MTDTRTCPICGAPVAAADQYCPNCGSALAYLVPLSALERAQPDPNIADGERGDALLTLEVDYPERLSRWKIFVKLIFAVPHLIVLSFFGMLVSIVVWIAWLCILITKRYPESLYQLVMTNMRWTANVNAYVMLQRDEYPPFGEGPYPVRLELPYPAELSRWLIFIKWLLVIPNVFVLGFLGIALIVAVGIAWLCILITARMPRGLFDFITGVNRWGYRVNAYTWLMTDKYPPFSLD